MTAARTFRQRLVQGDRLVSTFVKTTSHQTVEVLSATGLDAVVLDAEHAPFGLESLDRCLGAALGVGMNALVRIPALRSDTILQPLDMGACGVLVPHVDDAAQAQLAVSAARYVGGCRGFSTSARAGRYGDEAMSVHLRTSDEHAAVIVQIESMASVSNAGAIASVPGVDCLFIGPADLAVSLGVSSMTDERVQDAVAEVCRQAIAAGCAVGSFVSDVTSIPPLAAQGVSFFVLGSDQSWLKRMARQLVAQVRDLEQENTGRG
jgi:2-keto-3-deoxy-L-rhamnonate aldolase RhmA